MRAAGGEHAEIIDGLPGCPNLGFIVDGVYHPGDSLFVPTEAVDTLLVPASGPWLKLGEAVEFVRAVRPARAFPIHDAHLNEVGLETFDWWLDAKGGTDYARIPLGASVTLEGSAPDRDLMVARPTRPLPVAALLSSPASTGSDQPGNDLRLKD